MENTNAGGDSNKTPKKKRAGTAVAATIIIVLILAGLTTLPQVKRYLPEQVNSASEAAVSYAKRLISGERIRLYVNTEVVNSGESFELSWIHRNQQTEGTYAISYPCLDGLSISVEGETAASADLECGIAVDLDTGEDYLTVTPSVSGTGDVTVPFGLSFTENGAEEPTVSDEVSVLVVAQATTTGGSNKPTVPTSTPKLQPGPRTETTYPIAASKPDLAVRILDSGRLDSSNAYTASAEVKAGDKVAVRFEIENIGIAMVAGYVFNAVLPTTPAHTFTSDEQEPLNPGEKVEYTLGFDATAGTAGSVEISVDPKDVISEASEFNNTDTAQVRVGN